MKNLLSERRCLRIKKRNVIIPIVALTLAGLAIVGAARFGTAEIARAEAKGNPLSGLVQLIAQKFNLDQNQVQTVFDQYRTEQKQTMQQNREQRELNRLNQLVQDKKITDAQKQAILDELAALRNKYNPANFKSMTADQRKQQFQAEQDEIKAWANSQGIDPSFLMPGFGMHRGRGWMNKFKPTPTP